MDALVELIIWLLKGLFGEQEKPADMSRRSDGASKARGPYNYDETGAPRPSGAPKTLEEILEEVRRQAAEKQSGGARPPQQPQAPVPQPRQPIRPPPRQVPTRNAPQPQQQPPAPARTPRTVMAESLPSAEASGNREAPKAIKEIRSDRREQPQAIETSGLYVPKELVTKEALPSEESRPVPPQQAARELGGIRGGLLVNPDTVVARRAAPGIQLDLLTALRKAPPATRKSIVRQALMLNEIFGPPRSQRPHVPGGSMLPPPVSKPASATK